jgi:hypothetical protein
MKMSLATKRKLSKSMKASYRRRKAAREEQAEHKALALFEQQVNGVASAEPTIRVSQMADFVVALVDAARRSK